MTDPVDWDDLGEAIADLEMVVATLRSAWANDAQADAPRLQEVRYLLGKVESSVFGVKLAAG